MPERFRGTIEQKMDGKGRLSVPAPFRRVLEAGDEAARAGGLPRLVLLFGEHLGGALRIMTVDGMEALEARAEALPDGPMLDTFHDMISAASWQTEVDRDGRIVMPPARREQLGLPEGGMLRMAGMGRYVRVTNLAAPARPAAVEEFIAAQGPNFDPLTLLNGL
ncbi:MAG: division/cell wall cluster transcriptional repressor MraZ [Paracoccaceae bacterium]